MAKSAVKKGTGKRKAAAKEPRFFKRQLMESLKYAGYRDMLCVLLDNERSYTSAEVKLLLETFLKGKVMD